MTWNTEAELKRLAELRSQYDALLHKMQTGVAVMMEHGSAETEPKHLRVGVNAAMSDAGAIVNLLIQKGLLTEIEVWQALVDGMRREADGYKRDVQKAMGPGVELG